MKYDKVSSSSGDVVENVVEAEKPNKCGIEFYALIAMMLSALFFSCMNVFVKLVADKGVPATQLVSIRAIGQSVVILTGLYMRKDNDE